jgi:hypothetical protein
MIGFSPIDEGTKGLNAGTASGSVEIGTKGNLVMVTNISDTVIYVRLGDSTVTADATKDTPIQPVTGGGSVVFLAKSLNQTHIAARTASGDTKAIRFTPGFAG